MLIHSVYFWLKEGLSENEKRSFVSELNKLSAIRGIVSTFVGVPADTNRPVVERSYTYALIINFVDNGAQEAYQVDPIHKAFVEKNRPLWTKIVVFDSVNDE